MIKVILDTNTIISGLGWEGSSQQIMNRFLNDEFKIVISPEILKEVENVLFRDKFSFIDKSKKEEFILILSELTEIVNPKLRLRICRDENDNKFLELAVESNANYIVSGDLDLLSIKEYNRIKILSSKDFLNILKKSKP